MTPLQRSDDAFRYLVDLRGTDGDGETDLIALFTFALIEQDRIEWAEHRRGMGAAEPNEADTQAWYESKPESYMQDKLRRGEEWFATFARAWLKEEIDDDRTRAVEEATRDLRSDVQTSQAAVLKAIGDAQDKSGHYGRGAVQGALGNLLFAAAVIFILWISAHPADLIAWGRARLGL